MNLLDQETAGFERRKLDLSTKDYTRFEENLQHIKLEKRKLEQTLSWQIWIWIMINSGYAHQQPILEILNKKAVYR